MSNAVFETYKLLGASSSAGGSTTRAFDLFDMPNPLNISFFGSSDPYSTYTSQQGGVEQSMATNSMRETPSIGDSGDSPVIGEEIGEDTVAELSEAGSVAALGETGPIGLAVLANQQIGQAVASSLEASQKDVVAQDYSANLGQHGLNVDMNAGLIRNNQEATIQSQASAAFAGSMFGPLGALIGHAIGGVMPADPTSFLTASSFNGSIDPSDTGIVASETTMATTGQSTMQDDITSN
nr:MAG: hypothetical protein [Polycipiviridae sp. XZN141292]